MFRIRFAAVLLACAVLAGTGYGAGSNSRAQTAGGCQTFPETGQTVCDPFLTYWRDHGGLAQQGYPISPEFTEISDLNGRPYQVQYFERAVFEKHPENKPPYDVLLSQLGTVRARAKYPQGFPGAAAGYPGKIAFTTRDAQPQVATINPDGTGRQVVAAGRSPLFSPDGSRLAFLAALKPVNPGPPWGQVAIRSVALDGTNPQDTCTTDANAQIDLVRWSPRNRFIALNAGQNPPGDIYLCDLAAKHLGPAVQGPQGATTLVYDWAPDGNAALWQAGPQYRDLSLYYGDPEQPATAKQVTHYGNYTNEFGLLHYADARISPDGKTIAVAGYTIFFVGVPGQNSPLDGKALSGVGQPRRIAWSPDGRALAFEDATAHTVNIVEIASGHITKLVDGAALGDWSPR